MGKRMWASALVAIAALAGCGSDDDTPGTPSGAANPRPASSSATPSGPPPATPTTAAGPALTCDALRDADLSWPAAEANNYPLEIQFADGAWSGDGLNVSMRECAIGDLDGDGRADGLTSLVFNNGGTGQFYYLAHWNVVGGQPHYQSSIELGDRTPVEKLTIGGGKATVVILTRTPDLPPAATTIRRTATYALSGSTLVEQGHTDAPYTPAA